MQSNHKKENENRKIAILGKTRRWMRGFIQAESYRNALKKKWAKSMEIFPHNFISMWPYTYIRDYCFPLPFFFGLVLVFFFFLSKKGRESLEFVIWPPL